MDNDPVGPGVVIGRLQSTIIVEVERHTKGALFYERHVDFLTACYAKSGLTEAALRTGRGLCFDEDLSTSESRLPITSIQGSIDFLVKA
jgi:hypothetical protein